MSTKRSLNSLCALLVMSVITLSACSIYPDSTGSRSSAADYLYPESEQQEIKEGIPHLSLPLRVGVAFVPASQAYSTNNYSLVRNSSAVLTEQQKLILLEQVAENFRGLEYVSRVEVIPSAYLQPGGSFSNLGQLQSMYGVDVIALVSHDQIQFTDQDVLSLSYWTIVGAYIVSGEKNDTNTLLDTVVFDISSQQLLFRAPGSSHISGRSTPINLKEELREDSQEGYEKATVQMIANLKTELSRFEQRVKSEPETIKVSRRGGGGSANLVICLLLAIVAILRVGRVGRPG